MQPKKKKPIKTKKKTGTVKPEYLYALFRQCADDKAKAIFKYVDKKHLL